MPRPSGRASPRKVKRRLAAHVYLAKLPVRTDAHGHTFHLPRPTAAVPGSEAKIQAMIARRRRRENLHHPSRDARIPDDDLPQAADPFEPPFIPTLVALVDIATLVDRSPDTLRRWSSTNGIYFPKPVEIYPNRWHWHEVRPWLESFLGITLPEEFPYLRWDDVFGK